MSELVVEDGNQRQHRQRLKGLLDKSDDAVRIASAYVTDTDLLIGIKNRNIHLLTSLLPMNIASGVTSLESLRELIESGVECRFLPEHLRLHAKVYISGDTSAVVTSANLTASAFDSNIEVGVELGGQDVHILTKWFDELWAKAHPLALSDLAALRQQTAAMRRDYLRLKRKTISQLTLPEIPLASDVFLDELRDLLENANRFYVCNTDRRQGERTTTGGYALEEEMYNRGYAAAWETFKFPPHMREVQPGDAIFMYAKGVGLIGIGRANTKCETLDPNDPDRIRNFANENNTREWRIRVDWLDWRDDDDTYRWKSPNFTFWNVTDSQYRDLRERVRKHFLGQSRNAAEQGDEPKHTRLLVFQRHSLR